MPRPAGTSGPRARVRVLFEHPPDIARVFPTPPYPSPPPCAGILVANPTDVVKVRLQAELRSGGPRRYSGTLDAYRTIVRFVCMDVFVCRGVVAGSEGAGLMGMPLGLAMNTAARTRAGVNAGERELRSMDMKGVPWGGRGGGEVAVAAAASRALLATAHVPLWCGGRAEGLGGLYRALVPNIMRNSLMNMAELVRAWVVVAGGTRAAPCDAAARAR